MDYKMLYKIRIGGKEVNCLYTMNRKCYSTGEPAPVVYYDMLKPLIDILKRYNKGIVRDYKNDVVKAIKLFELDDKRLKENSYALANVRYSDYVFMDTSVYEESIAISKKDMDENIENADAFVFLDLDRKTIQFSFFCIVDREVIEKEYDRRNRIFEINKLDQVDYDFDNLPIIDLDDFLMFVKKHNIYLFRLKGRDDKLVYMKENLLI